jgi:uncharacterized protein (TIGR02466 family)
LNKIDKNDFEEIQLFPTSVYSALVLDDLELVKKVAEDPIYHHPTDRMMSETFFDDERIFDFSQFILQSSWNILKHQGYLMENYHTVFESMWLQTYEKHSYMAQHVHANGNQIVGFYFLEVPENSVQLILHDPRAGKVQIDLDDADPKQLTTASSFSVLTPRAGQLILTPAWLAHSITANQSDEQVKFVHINIQAKRIANNIASEMPEVEVV